MTDHAPLTDEDRLSGATFMVRTVAFRCIDILGLCTPLYECNRCTAVVTDPDRHLARAACEDDLAAMREVCQAAADFLRTNHGKTLDLSESDASLNDAVGRFLA